jgi:predicted PurR-regulated permease PerM
VVAAERERTTDGTERVTMGLVAVIAAVAVVWLLRAAAIVAIPLATAFFIAIVVYPVQRWLGRRLTRARWAAVPLTMTVVVVVIGGGMWALAESVDEAVEAAPRYAPRVAALWNDVRAAIESSGVPVPENLLASTDVQRRLASLGASLARVAWETLTGLVLVFFLVLLMLLEGSDWSRNARRLLPDDRGTHLADDITGIAGKVRQFLYVRTVLGLLSAVAAAAWLLALGVDLVLVWAVLTFLLNYVPNLGSILAAVPPSLMAVIQFGPVHGLAAAAGLAAIEQVIGNYIDPRMQGRRLQLSPVVVLVALVFWTWMWGPAGALLSVPLTVTLLAAASHTTALRNVAALLERS